MQQYIVTKNFNVGEIGQTLQAAQAISFDGTTLVIGDKNFVAPSLSVAVRKGWVVPTGSANSVSTLTVQKPATVNKTTQGDILARYKVTPHETSDSPLPPKQPRPLIDFGVDVISDADEEDVAIEDALPSLKAKKAARESLKSNASEEIPNLEVQSDGGPTTKLQREPKQAKKSFVDSLPLVNTKVSVPLVDPVSVTKVYGGVVFSPEEAKELKSDTVEILEVPKAADTEAKKDNKKPKAKKPVKAEEDHLVLAQSLGAEPLARPMDEGVPSDWKSLSFRDRKNFVDEATDVAVLKSLLLVEKGAVKKFITSKLENLT